MKNVGKGRGREEIDKGWQIRKERGIQGSEGLERGSLCIIKKKLLKVSFKNMIKENPLLYQTY